FSKLPKTQLEMKHQTGEFVLVGERSTLAEGAEGEELKASGQGLVLPNYMKQDEVLKLMQTIGINVTTGSKEADKEFFDILVRFSQQEAAYQRRLIDYGRETTRALGESLTSSLDSMETAIREAELA